MDGVALFYDFDALARGDAAQDAAIRLRAELPRRLGLSRTDREAALVAFGGLCGALAQQSILAAAARSGATLPARADRSGRRWPRLDQALSPAPLLSALRDALRDRGLPAGALPDPDMVASTPVTPPAPFRTVLALGRSLLALPLPRQGTLPEAAWPGAASRAAAEEARTAFDRYGPLHAVALVLAGAHGAASADPHGLAPGCWRLDDGPIGIRVAALRAPG